MFWITINSAVGAPSHRFERERNFPDRKYLREGNAAHRRVGTCLDAPPPKRWPVQVRKKQKRTEPAPFIIGPDRFEHCNCARKNSSRHKGPRRERVAYAPRFEPTFCLQLNCLRKKKPKKLRSRVKRCRFLFGRVRALTGWRAGRGREGEHQNVKRADFHFRDKVNLA